MLLIKTLKSSTLKLALISIAAFGIVVLTLFTFVRSATVSYVVSRSDRAIAIELAHLQEVFSRDGREGLRVAISQRIENRGLEAGHYLLVDETFASIAGNVSQWPSFEKDGARWRTFRTGRWGPGPDQALVRGAFTALGDDSHLMVAQTIEDLDHFAGIIDIALAAGVVLIFLLAAVASLLVTRRTVGRIESINSTCRDIMTSGLGLRIPVRGTRDEWDHLSINLNAMLDRIEALMGELKQATDNVAHDLRTPLTRMRARLENAMNCPRDSARDELLMGDLLADLDNVLRMFSSLIRISQIEASTRTEAFQSVNLADIAKEVVELFDAAAEEAGLKLRVVGEPLATLKGDRDLLFDALANLIDNAIKHGNGCRAVNVETARIGDDIAVSVVDDGPGIPADEISYVTRRFYRLERSRGTPGNGLGLSLVAAVARLHGAQLEVENNLPGLMVRLRFPLMSDRFRLL